MAARKRGEGKTPHRTIRAEDDIWLPFDEAVRHQDQPDRSTVLRNFMAWYIRVPGSKLPTRPGPDWRAPNKINGTSAGTEDVE